MTIIYHEFTVNDTLKPLNCQLQYENSLDDSLGVFLQRDKGLFLSSILLH